MGIPRIGLPSGSLEGLNASEREDLSWSEVADRDSRGLCPSSPDYAGPHIVTDGATCDECGATVTPVEASTRPAVVVVCITNTYADRESTEDVTVPAPDNPADLEEWWQETVFPQTGDGGGGYAVYTAEIIEADTPGLIGQRYIWEG